MSWSTSKMGTKAEVKDAVLADLDICAKGYAGTEEEKDILLAKERLASAIDGFTSDAIQVDASGSRGSGWFTLSLQIKGLSLVLPKAAPPVVTEFTPAT